MGGVPWRIGFGDGSQMESAQGGKPLDEVVISGLLHVEALDQRANFYFVEVAGRAFWVHCKRGEWTITSEEDRRKPAQGKETRK